MIRNNTQFVLQQIAAKTCSCSGLIAVKVMCRQITALLLRHSLTRRPRGRSLVYYEFCHMAIIVSKISVSLNAIPNSTKSIAHLYLNIILQTMPCNNKKYLRSQITINHRRINYKIFLLNSHEYHRACDLAYKFLCQ